MRGRRALRWGAVGVGAIGLAELLAHVYFANAAPTLAEWSALRPVVQDLVQGETLVLVAPEWAQPNARFALGKELMPLAHVARPDESRFARALEISILGETHSDVEGWRLESERREGDFTLRTWANPQPTPPVYDFLARAEPPHLSVSVVSPKGVTHECKFSATARVSNGDLFGHPTFPAQRFICSRKRDWSFVGRTVIEDHDYAPRQCLWAHPTRSGVLTLSFDSVPIGSSIHGHGAMPYFFSRESRGTPIIVSIWVGGEELGRVTHRDGEGWKPFEVSTERFRGQTLPVEFRVQSRRDSKRQFCFQAEMR